MPESEIVPKNILVAKLCCIGDVVYMTPMLRAIKQAYPETTIYYLAVPWVKDVVEQIPYVDEVILYEAPLSEQSVLKKGMETISLIKKLRRLHIDTMFIGHRNKIFALLGKLSGIPVRIGFSEQGGSYLTHPVEFNPQQFEIARYLELLQAIHIPTAGTQTEMNPFTDEIERVTSALARYGIRQGEPLLGLFPGGGENPGTSMPIKRWPPELFVELCNKLLAAQDRKILLLGGPTDYQLNESIIKGLIPGSSRIINVANDFSLRSIPALMQRCSLIVGGDTGPLHIAAAVGTPTLFLFGPTHPALHAPQNENSTFLWKHIECSPCHTPVIAVQKKYFQGKNFPCWKGTNECMKAITVDEVFNSVSQILLK